MSRVAALEVDLHERELLVRIAFDAFVKDMLKVSYEARWSPRERAWRVPLELRGPVERFLLSEGYRLVGDVTERPTTSPIGSPVVALLAWLPEPLRTPTFRALATVWHPDHGG